MWSGAIKQAGEADAESFAEFDLGDRTLDVLWEIGFESPTPVQSLVLEPALAGRDVVGLAETGSGKTAAFCLPLIEEVCAAESPGPHALVLSPTREIALQTHAFLEHFAQLDPRSSTDKGRRPFSVCVIGGVPIGPQLDALRAGSQIVVATPGRLIDHADRGSVDLGRVHQLVLDEADHMLDLGFWPQIQDILRRLPEERRTMMFSATMPDLIERIAHQHLREPVLVDLRPDGSAAAGIEHRLYLVAEKDKKACCLSLLESDEGSTLVFTRRKSDAEWLCRVLERTGHEVERIHSDRSQGHRVNALKGFREGDHRILVATDIAARGIDVPGISHIVNFNLPDTAEDYIHRAGRTARGSAQGIVSSIGTWLDKSKIRSIERALGAELPRCTAPGVAPYRERQKRLERKKRSPLRR